MKKVILKRTETFYKVNYGIFYHGKCFKREIKT